MFKIKPKTVPGFNETRPKLGLEPNPDPRSEERRVGKECERKEWWRAGGEIE